MSTYPYDFNLVLVHLLSIILEHMHIFLYMDTWVRLKILAQKVWRADEIQLWHTWHNDQIFAYKWAIKLFFALGFASIRSFPEAFAIHLRKTILYILANIMCSIGHTLVEVSKCWRVQGLSVYSGPTKLSREANIHGYHHINEVHCH